MFGDFQPFPLERFGNDHPIETTIYKWLALGFQELMCFSYKKYFWPEVEVVITFPTIWGSGVSWWRVDGAPIEWSLPFPWHIDWHRLVVEVSIDRLLEGMVCCLGPI